ncbi:MAG: hypothetical protein EXQ70_06380 [Solirubrobacterales bacterium]|nr:hypothetical protein [Solirubrobacterales bacterium]
MSSTVEKARSLLEERRGELRRELDQIEKALTGLGAKRRGPGRPRGSGGERRRRRGRSRADQAAKIVADNPGITASEIAKKMSLKAPNYLYRVLPELQKEGRVRKDGKGYHAA